MVGCFMNVSWNLLAVKYVLCIAILAKKHMYYVMKYTLNHCQVISRNIIVVGSEDI